jgi:DNA polymerase-1
MLNYAAHVMRVTGQRAAFAADIETTGLGSPRAEQLLSIAIAWRKNTVLVFTGEEASWLAPVFQSEHIAWTWHNGKYDTEHLYNLFGFECPVDEDTMLSHYAINELRGTHGLKELAAEWLGADDYEQGVKRYLRKKTDSFTMVPKGALYRYNAQDTDYTFQLQDLLLEELRKFPGLVKLYYNLLLPASSFLQRIERRGIYVNQDRLKEVSLQLSLEMERLQAEYNLFAGFHINLNSWMQVSDLMYNRWKWPRLNRKKPNSVNEETIDLLKAWFTHRGGAPRELDALLEYRGVAKEKSSYVDNIWDFLESDSRVHQTYLIHGSHTGRLSCRNPAMQTIPREGPVKSIFQAPPGRVLLELDYSQAELRVLAHLSGDTALRRIFESGRSLHREVAVSIYGENYTPYEYIRTKALNFGIPYGRKAPSIAAEHKIPIREAEDMIRIGWIEQFPQAWGFLERQAVLARRGTTLVSPFGRHRHLGMAMSEDKLEDLINEAKNFKMQSGASDLTLISGISMEHELDALDAGVVNIVHDSLLIETDPALVREVAHVAATHMRNVPRDVMRSAVPFDVEAKVGVAWGYSMEELVLDS